MKKLKVTKKQAKRLLKMCKYYYPNNFNNMYKDDDELFLDYMIEEQMVEFPIPEKLSAKDKKEGIISSHTFEMIHWYEFVLTYLSHKLKNTEGFDYWYLTIAPQHCQSQGHPIDYLYNMYKEQKK